VSTPRCCAHGSGVPVAATNRPQRGRGAAWPRRVRRHLPWPVRVVRGEADFGRLRTGDVMVCPVTTPAWTVRAARRGRPPHQLSRHAPVSQSLSGVPSPLVRRARRHAGAAGAVSPPRRPAPRAPIAGSGRGGALRVRPSRRTRLPSRSRAATRRWTAGDRGDAQRSDPERGDHEPRHPQGESPARHLPGRDRPKKGSQQRIDGHHDPVAELVVLVVRAAARVDAQLPEGVADQWDGGDGNEDEQDSAGWCDRRELGPPRRGVGDERDAAITMAAAMTPTTSAGRSASARNIVNASTVPARTPRRHPPA
jgi:hypothetical protein